MGKVRIKIDEVSKTYRLGQVGTGTLSHDLNRFWAKIRGKSDPLSLVGGVNDRTKKSQDESVLALEKISFDVKEGEVLGIIGRNGAGKSTLLKVLSKVTGPSMGEIKINGRIGSLLEVGTGMHPELTGVENIYLNGAILGMTKKEITNKLEEIIEFAGIAKYADTPFKRYSSGMRVRLGFAVAAFLEPEILIVDEVLAVGDIEFQNKAIGKIKDVSQRQGRTVLFVSHNMASIQNLCDRVIVLDKGKVVFDGSAVQGIRYYLKKNMLSSEISLKDRTDRKAGKKFRFSKVAILDKDKSEILHPICGMRIIIRIYFESSLELVNIIFRMQIIGKNGNVLSVLNNFHSSKAFDRISKNYVDCKIDKLPLLDGEYSINLLALKFKEVIDEIEFAHTITVEAGDYFGTGKLPSIKEGILIDHSWSLD